jgi:hypothetical protein
MRTRTKVLLLLGVLVVAAAAIGITLEWRAVQRYRTGGEFEAEVRAALPIGSTEASINEYVDSQGWDNYGTHTRGFGERQLSAQMREPGTFFIPAKLRLVTFVLDDRGSLARIEVDETNDDDWP